MADCCLIKKVVTVEVYENKNEVRAYGFMAGDRNTPVMEVRFKHLWGESNLSTCKLRWIIVDDVGSLLVGEVPIQSDNTALINLPNELFTGDRRMKVQLTVASCDGERILNLQQFTDLKVINSLAPNEVVEPVYQILINQLYDESQKYLKELETSYTQKYGSLDSLYKSARASLEQYLITAENGGNAEFLQGYSPVHFQKVENTINDLIDSTKYEVGDVVEVLGYYAKGDGSHHKRVAKAEDDGSGELGQNGIWWCIVHSGEVNVSWFGAKGDGVTDDTVAIIKAHKTAYNTFSKIKYDANKSYVIKNNETIKIRTSVDFANSTIIYEEDFNTLAEKLFLIESDSKFQKYTSVLGDSVNVDYPKIQEKNIPDNSLVVLSSVLERENYTPNYKPIYVPELAEVRSPDICIYTRKGYLNGGIFDNIKTVENIFYREIDSQKTVLKNLKLKLNGKNNRAMASLFCITRDNTVIKNVKIDREYTKVCERRNLFHFKQCYNSSFENVISTEPVNLNNTNTANYEGYILRLDLVFKFSMKKIEGLNHFKRIAENNTTTETSDYGVGWFFMGGQFINGLLVEDCELSRIDSHSKLKDLFVQRSVLNVAQGQFVGNTVIKDTVFIFGEFSLAPCMLQNYSGNTPSYNNTSGGNLLLSNIKLVNCDDRRKGVVNMESSERGFDKITLENIYSNTPMFLRTNANTPNTKTEIRVKNVSKNIIIEPFDYQSTAVKNQNIFLEDCAVELAGDTLRPSAKTLFLKNCELTRGKIHQDCKMAVVENLIIDQEKYQTLGGTPAAIYETFGNISMSVNGVSRNSYNFKGFKESNVVNFGDRFIYNNKLCTATRNNVNTTTSLIEDVDFISVSSNQDSIISNYLQDGSEVNLALDIPTILKGILMYKLAITENGSLVLLVGLNGNMTTEMSGKQFDIIFKNPTSFDNRAGVNKVFVSQTGKLVALGFYSQTNGFNLKFPTITQNEFIYSIQDVPIKNQGIIKYSYK